MAEHDLNNDPLKDPSPDGSSEFDLTPKDLIDAGIRRIVEQNMENLEIYPPKEFKVLNSQMAECVSAVLGNKDRIEHVARQIMEIKSLYGVLEAAAKENTALSQQYFNDHILEPMAQSLLPINDLIEDTISSWLDTAAAIDPSILQLLEAVRMQLMQFFGLYGIEYIRHEPGSVFDPQIMKPATIAETAVSELDGKIAKSLQAGFRLNGRRLLRPESVVLYRFVRLESL